MAEPDRKKDESVLEGEHAHPTNKELRAGETDMGGGAGAVGGAGGTVGTPPTEMRRGSERSKEMGARTGAAGSVGRGDASGAPGGATGGPTTEPRAVATKDDVKDLRDEDERES